MTHLDTHNTNTERETDTYTHPHDIYLAHHLPRPRGVCKPGSPAAIRVKTNWPFYEIQG